MDLDLEKLLEEQKSADNKKKWLGVAGDVMSGITSVQSPAEILLGMQRGKGHGEGLKEIASNMRDPMDRQSKAMSYLKDKRDGQKAADEDSRIQALKDPNSSAAKAFLYQVKNAGISVPEGASAYDLYSQGFNPARLAEINAQNNADLRKFQMQERMKKQEANKELEVPGLGQALTLQDAKDLKDMKTTKEEFDRQLSELIGLRKEYGGEVMNREAVGRAKQLSNDLLLKYKNLSKLGVLSQSDQNIINEIIPQDPLQFNASGLFGQDPTLNKLEKFKEDSNSQFASNVRNRLKGGEAVADSLLQKNAAAPESAAPEAKAGKTVVKKQVNKKLGKTRVTYSDGSVEELDGIQ
jgi:hypothetical protein